mmetsp:Transcript_22259/g.50846  ORF Transcript_22259/g.50846 Transcript_22259/m.50846 type:complete len:633 (+) Transcript_22259:52-1950(+)
MGAKESVSAERGGQRFAPLKRRSFSLGKKGSVKEQQRGTASLPSAEEVRLADRLVPEASPKEGPPFYAITDTWLAVWRVFVLEGGVRPGPIDNSKLLRTSEDVCWLSARDWHILYGCYGGGPILCRHTKELFVSTEPVHAADGGRAQAIGHATSSRGLLDEEPSPRTSAASTNKEAEVTIRKACNSLTWKCRDFETDLRAEVDRLQAGPWRVKVGNKAIVPARQRICNAVKANCGGEELRSALQDLLSIAPDPHVQKLEEKVYDLCAHEEAQIVLVCILQALKDADRLGLEMWLEQAQAMGVEQLAANTSIYAPLRRRLNDLEECEKRALAGHAHAALPDEDPAARLWRQTMFAVEANDEDTLMLLIEEAEASGMDASAAWMALEELRARRTGVRSQRGASSSSTSAPTRPPRNADRQEDPPRRTRANGTIPGNAPRRGSAWHEQETEDDDFLTKYRKWRGSSWHDQETEDEDFLTKYRKWKSDYAGEFPPYGYTAKDAEEQRKAKAEAEAALRRKKQEEEDAARRERQRREEEARDRARRAREEAEDREAKRRQQQQQRFTSAPVQSRGDALRTLGLPPRGDPSVAEIKSAYRKAALKAHPDRPHNHARKEQATEEFQRVKAAFDLLVGAS